jgi:nucleoside-diphosphate-sugar epimerase
VQQKLTVLVTGSAGRIGRAVVSELQVRGHAVRGLDRVPTPGLPGSVPGDVADPAVVARAMGGIHSLIHLAAVPDDVETPRAVLEELFPANITGLYHVMEAARTAGVRRVILASSGQVNWWQQQRGPWPITTDHAPSPKYWYAATKMFMESIGRGYAEMHGLSVVIARLGWCPRTRAQVGEIAAQPWAQDVYLSPGDAGRFFADAVEAPETVRFATVYAASRFLHTQRFDLEPARTLLGYEPREQWPQGVERILADGW